MQKYESHLQMAFRLGLLWRGDLKTINFNPEFSCKDVNFCQMLDRGDRRNGSWMTNGAESFPYNSPDILQLIKTFASRKYREVSEGLELLSKREIDQEDTLNNICSLKKRDVKVSLVINATIFMYTIQAMSTHRSVLSCV